MDLDVVRADLASWERRRWCACRISPREIRDIVDTIDTMRAPRTRVVTHVRDAARLSIALREAMSRRDCADNDRLDRAGGRSAGALIGSMFAHGGLPGIIEAAAWRARNAIEAALYALDSDLPLAAFGVRHSFTSPVYALTFRGQSQLVDNPPPSPYTGVAKLYLAGCYPMGYVDDCFVVFAP